jgi:hypothetical protein
VAAVWPVEEHPRDSASGRPLAGTARSSSSFVRGR